MKRPRRTLYCWLRPSTLRQAQGSGQAEWRLGRDPPDVAVRYIAYPSLEEVESAADSMRANVIWCGDAARTREQLMAGNNR